jgi:ribose transport system substrate-binding protein
MFRYISAPALLLIGFTVGCGGTNTATTENGDNENPQFPLTAGKYVILDILTDGGVAAEANDNAEDTLTKHPDIKGMVGLWGYNIPACITALEDQGKVGEVELIGFDEQAETLQGIKEGKVHGTVVQQPYDFGFKSVEYLAAMIRGQEFEIPENKMIFIEHLAITPENVDAFERELSKKENGKAVVPLDVAEHDMSERVKVAFLVNGPNVFWNLAEMGLKDAGEKFNAEVAFKVPSDTIASEQNSIAKGLVATGIQGLAISPVDAVNQTDLINEISEEMKVICMDSDSPKSNREFYVGTSNYLAGRTAGKMIKEAIPDGGKIMLFVGKMEVLNAQERSRGIIDELMDKPLPEEYQGVEFAASSTNLD